ncbi:LysR family transcriptional regulator [Veronia nyctiphanis]|uniref:LysR family transcriptional regulator n=1 Tax=Veronia nyctiphanis TaxID=1278244 RepID=A0A4Q0YY41_9GAMM|nr:LysR substrate-binding domain-containing protein [Veronia nyctiphanis]RXJ74129.1 LysR family transcriptional regulator [Veronia nyctiphanis]
MNRLAHLNGIKAFEAAARHLSFVAAAEELNVTPAAVGQQVRQLEDWLGVKLFIRATSGQARLTLTEEAKLAYPEIYQGFNLIMNGLSKLKSPNFDDKLTVSVSPSIGAKWLLPRIADFQIRFPDYDLCISTNIAPLDYAKEAVDVGIRYGSGEWDGHDSLFLMDEMVFPVCSPEFAEKYNLAAGRESELGDVPFLFDVSLSKSKLYPTWNEWFVHKSITVPDCIQGLKINSSSEVIDAAIRGEGLALGRSVLVERDMEAGKLVCPFNIEEVSHRSNFCYYVVWASGVVVPEKVEDFKLWLQAQVN